MTDNNDSDIRMRNGSTIYKTRGVGISSYALRTADHDRRLLVDLNKWLLKNTRYYLEDDVIDAFLASRKQVKP